MIKYITEVDYYVKKLLFQQFLNNIFNFYANFAIIIIVQYNGGFIMIERFYPDMMVDSVEQIDLDMLKEKGIKGLILDIDNTLVPSFIKEADERTLKWIDLVKKKGFNACILSNARKKRVQQFNEKLGLKAIYRASKPGRRAFAKALDVLCLDASQTAVIGDQIFTDVYGGNRLGMYTILVKPIHKEEFFFVKLKRYPEKYILKRYYNDVKN